MCNLTLWKVRVTSVAVKTQQRILRVLLSYTSLPTT
jgi:hypothetical protein